MKHWTPRIADAAEAALATRRRDDRRARARAALLGALDQGYREQLERALGGRAELRFVDSWHDEPGFVDLLAAKIRGTDAHVVFTAHSLPARILDRGRPVQGAAARDVAPRRRRAPASSAGRSRSRASRRPASRGSGPTSSTTSPRCTSEASTACSSARSGSSPTTSRSAGISTSRRSSARASSELRLARIEMPNDDPRSCATLAGIVRRALAVPSPRVRAGEILVEHAARSFRVYPRENRALKDLLFARRHVAAPRSGRCATSRSGSSPGARSASSAATAPGKTTLLRLLSGIVKPTSGRVAVGGRIGSLLELGAGFHPDMTGRENVYLNGSIHGLAPRRDPREARRDRRVRRARGLHRPAGAHVLVGDVHAARLRDRRAHRGRRPAARRGLRRRRRGVPAQVLRQDLRVQAARRHDRVRLARRRRRSSGSAIARCC